VGQVKEAAPLLHPNAFHSSSSLLFIILSPSTPLPSPAFAGEGLVRGHAGALSRTHRPDFCLSLTPATSDRVALVQSRGRRSWQGARGVSAGDQAVLPFTCLISPVAACDALDLVPERRCVAARLGSAVALSIHLGPFPPFTGDFGPRFPRPPVRFSRKSTRSRAMRELCAHSEKEKSGVWRNCGETANDCSRAFPFSSCPRTRGSSFSKKPGCPPPRA